jgi:predicted nucleic acid-binding protein
VSGAPYVIDTSVALDWYIPQRFSVEARRFLGAGVDRHAPDLLPVEAAHALLKRVRSVSNLVRHLSFDDANAVREALESAPIQLHPSLPLNRLAFVLAVEIGSSHYDGLFLALAIRLDGQVVTADKTFYNTIKNSPHATRVRWVEERP